MTSLCKLLDHTDVKLTSSILAYSLPSGGPYVAYLSRSICISCYLPARTVNGFQASLDHLHGLHASQSTKGVNIWLVVHQLPQLAAAILCKGVLNFD